MTSYHGGKQKIGEDIAVIIKQISDRVEEHTGVRFKGYVEPFCGMLGVYQHVPELIEDHKSYKYRAGDINESVIKMWKALQKGWKPPTKCSEKRFYELKGNGQSSAEKGFVGHACAFRGIYFATYKTGVNLKRSSDKLMEMSNRLKYVFFSNEKYTQFSKLKGYVVYCDPPYFSNSNYPDEFNIYRKFDYEAFYKWAEKMATHNLVFISERAKLPYKLVGKFKDNEKLYLIV
jgi:site-specific DNA-adenine methylase